MYEFQDRASDILRADTHETELGDHDFYLSRSHYTDTDPTSRKRAATAGIEPTTPSPGIACYRILQSQGVGTVEDKEQNNNLLLNYWTGLYIIVLMIATTGKKKKEQLQRMQMHLVLSVETTVEAVMSLQNMDIIIALTPVGQS